MFTKETLSPTVIKLHSNMLMHLYQWSTEYCLNPKHKEASYNAIVGAMDDIYRIRYR